MTLVRDEEALAWELRGYWLRGREIVVRLTRGATVPRIRGYVAEVAPTGAYARFVDAPGAEPILVPLWAVRAVRTPHFHEDGAAGILARFRPEPPTARETLPGQLALSVDDARIEEEGAEEARPEREAEEFEVGEIEVEVEADD